VGVEEVAVVGVVEEETIATIESATTRSRRRTRSLKSTIIMFSSCQKRRKPPSGKHCDGNCQTASDLLDQKGS
jgi:hypothetical protein